MTWTTPSEKIPGSEAPEKRLWATADQLRASFSVISQQYSQPVPGLIFLRIAEVRFSARRGDMEKAASSSRRGSRVGEQSAYRAKGVVYLSPNARFEHLLALAEGEAVGKAVIGAIGVLAKVCNSLTPWTRLTRLLQCPEPELSNNGIFHELRIGRAARFRWSFILVVSRFAHETRSAIGR